MFITPSFKKSLIVEQFQGNYLNMTRGDEDIEGGLQKCLDTRKGALKKLGRGGGLRKFVYFKTNRRGGLPKN